MYSSKNILFMLPLFKKQKGHTISSFSYPGSRKVLTSAKIIISGQKYYRNLMQDSLKYLFAQFGYDWAKNKEIVKGVERGAGPMPSKLSNLRKSQLCRVKEDSCHPCKYKFIDRNKFVCLIEQITGNINIFLWFRRQSLIVALLEVNYWLMITVSHSELSGAVKGVVLCCTWLLCCSYNPNKNILQFQLEHMTVL